MRTKRYTPVYPICEKCRREINDEWRYVWGDEFFHVSCVISDAKTEVVREFLEWSLDEFMELNKPIDYQEVWESV